MAHDMLNNTWHDTWYTINVAWMHDMMDITWMGYDYMKIIMEYPSYMIKCILVICLYISQHDFLLDSHFLKLTYIRFGFKNVMVFLTCSYITRIIRHGYGKLHDGQEEYHIGFWLAIRSSVRSILQWYCIVLGHNSIIEYPHMVHLIQFTIHGLPSST